MQSIYGINSYLYIVLKKELEDEKSRLRHKKKSSSFGRLLKW